MQRRSGLAASPHIIDFCSETTLIHGPSGKFVGEDELGNRYYENNDNQVGRHSSDWSLSRERNLLFGILAKLILFIFCAGRHRWVVYKDLSWPLGQEATAIAPDWHGNYHMSLQATPNRLSFLEHHFYIVAGWIHCLYDVPPSHVRPTRLLFLAQSWVSCRHEPDPVTCICCRKISSAQSIH